MNTTKNQTVTCHFIDICTPDYLTDHHNRDNEQLICSPISSEITDIEILDLLFMSLESHPEFDNFSDQEIRDTIWSEIVELEIGYVTRQLFQDFSESELEEHYIYCYLSC